MIPMVISIIAKTESFQRDMARTRQTIDSLEKQVTKVSRTISAFTKFGGMIYLANSTMDMATAMHKARREGDSMFDAFVQGLPIINRMAASAKNLAEELSGAAQAMAISDQLDKVLDKYDKINLEMHRNIQLQKAGKQNEALLKEQFSYEDRLKSIAAIEQETTAIKKHNAAIDEQIEKLRNKPFRTEIEFNANKENLIRQIEELQGKKIALPNLERLQTMAGTEYELGQKNVYEKMAEDAAKLAEKQIQQVTVVKDRWNEMSWSVESTFNSSIEAMIFKTEKFGNIAKSVFRDVAMAAMRALYIQPAADWAVYGLKGAFKGLGLNIGLPSVPAKEAHGGGELGRDIFPTRMVPASAFIGAPSYGGLGPGEHAIIGHEGERISRDGGAVTVNIHTDITPTFTSAQNYMVSDQRIIDVTILASETNGRFRRSIKQTANSS